MKKLGILTILSLAFSSLWAADDNTFYFSEAIVVPGQAADIELSMKNSRTDLTCIEAEIQLPEGLVVAVADDGTPACSLNASRMADHEILANILDDGNLKLLISSLSGAPVAGDDGAILTFRVEAESDAPRGESAVKTVGESLFVTNNAEALYSVGVEGKVIITDDPTGIHSIDNGELIIDNVNATYNLAGQRVSSRKAPRGIYIQGSKKIVKQ